jgi:hypothetical protein
MRAMSTGPSLRTDETSDETGYASSALAGYGTLK